MLPLDSVRQAVSNPCQLRYAWCRPWAIVVFWLCQSEGMKMERRIGHKRIGLVLIIVGSVFLLTAGATFAAGSSGAALAKEGALLSRSSDSAGFAATGAISGTTPITGGQIIALFIAEFFDVEVSKVMDLHFQGYGFGELAIAYALAQEYSPAQGEDSLTVEDILADKASGIGWGEIAMSLGLHPGNRDRNLGRIVSGRVGISDTIPISTTHQPGPPDGKGPPDHAGAPEDKGPPDHAGPKDHSGAPDHAGPNDNNNKHSK